MKIKKESKKNSEAGSELEPESDYKKGIILVQAEGVLLKRRIFVLLIAAAAIFIFGVLFLVSYLNENRPASPEREELFFPTVDQVEEENAEEKQETVLVIEETSTMKKSKSEDWWLNSGGIMSIGSREFATNMGSLSQDSRWRKLYFKTNSKDTDKGYYPQNIFRLVSKSKWNNFSQSVYFKIEKVNLSPSENRNESNGILFFNRYQDGDNLYYAGIRVDGHAVIKKKINEEYYTLKEKEFFTNGEKYDKEKNPNLIPPGSWIGIKSEIINIDDETVDIKFYIDREQKGEWQLVLEAKDSQGKNGTKPFLKKGYAGIRTDFMDVRFKDYKIIKI